MVGDISHCIKQGHISYITLDSCNSNKASSYDELCTVHVMNCVLQVKQLHVYLVHLGTTDVYFRFRSVI